MARTLTLTHTHTHIQTYTRTQAHTHKKMYKYAPSKSSRTNRVHECGLHISSKQKKHRAHAMVSSHTRSVKIVYLCSWIFCSLSLIALARTCVVFIPPPPQTPSSLVRTLFLYQNEWRLRRKYLGHIIHVNELCHMYGCVMSHAWMRPVTHTNEACHAYERAI